MHVACGYRMCSQVIEETRIADSCWYELTIRKANRRERVYYCRMAHLLEGFPKLVSRFV